MKYLFAAIISFLIFTPALAAKKAPTGLVASSTPLQPLDSGIAPNYNVNISGSADPNAPADSGSSSPAADAQQRGADEPVLQNQPGSFLLGSNSGFGWVFMALLIAFGVFVLVKVWRKK